MSSLLEESEKTGAKLAKEVDKLSSKLQDLEVRPPGDPGAASEGGLKVKLVS